MVIRNDLKWNVMIFVGRHNISAPGNLDTIFAGSYKISNAIVHSGYNHNTNVNDIALVRTANFIKFK